MYYGFKTIIAAGLIALFAVVPTVAEAYSSRSHDVDESPARYAHYTGKYHRAKYRTIRVWVRGHFVSRHGHRVWVRGHYELKRVLISSHHRQHRG